MKPSYSKDDLVNVEKTHDVLLAIDSDGCVFDSMTVKQRIFREGVIEFWGLESAADEVHRICEWVGLFSPWRGLNRFQLILKFFQSLKKYTFICGEVFPLAELEAFVTSGVTLSMDELERVSDEPGLMRVLDWSREMSRRIAAVNVFPMFDGVFQCLETLHAEADLIVVSQTTEDALVREWRHAEIDGFVDVIAGAELGSKRESLETSMTGRFGSEQTLMVGDATGDLDAARAAGCLFFPILPGDEVNSWKELVSIGLLRLKGGSFAGAYQEELLVRFRAKLSDIPPGMG